jgi:4-diphosphocytidyl-2-C-methyl-D-erythritol kinase
MIWTAALNDGQAVARFLAGCRNDLETPAVALQPAIGAVLALLSAQGECLLARMSGSGATCFALCENRAAAAALAARLLALHPDWWVTPTTLAGGRS